MTPAELDVFDRLTRQAANARRAESAAFSLLARMTVELEEARVALRSFDPAKNPSDWLSARRAVTSMEGQVATLLKTMGLTPMSRGKR